MASGEDKSKKHTPLDDQKKNQDELALFNSKLTQFNKEKTNLDDQKRKTSAKLKEWQEDLKRTWKDHVYGIEFYPQDEFSRKDISDYVAPYAAIEAAWKKKSSEEPINWEDVPTLYKKEYDALRKAWQDKHSGAKYVGNNFETEIKFEDWFPIPDKLIISTNKDSQGAGKKKFGGVMEGVAIGGLVGILALVIMSISCASTDLCGTQTITTNSTNADGTISTITQTQSVNTPEKILESQFVIILISVVIAPVFTKMLKEKYDIQVTESQISMIMTDALNSVKMYAKEANTLRDENGKIGEGNQRALRNLAFTSLESNYDPKKYKDLVSNVGSQIFEKAIEKAVDLNKMERFPLEKAQVQEIISQAIDATPQIIDWKDKSLEMKNAFIDGHIRLLLKNVGVEGWGSSILENVLDSEANKRILAAAIADKNNLLSNLELKDPNLKLLSTVLSAVSDSLAKPSKEK